LKDGQPLINIANFFRNIHWILAILMTNKGFTDSKYHSI